VPKECGRSMKSRKCVGGFIADISSAYLDNNFHSFLYDLTLKDWMPMKWF